jgi:hypothetical protein
MFINKFIVYVDLLNNFVFHFGSLQINEMQKRVMSAQLVSWTQQKLTSSRLRSNQTQQSRQSIGPV